MRKGYTKDLRDEDTVKPESSEEGTWLISYADLMTLLACFFILIVAFSNQEDPIFDKKVEEFSKYFKSKLVRKIDFSNDKKTKLRVMKKENLEDIEVERELTESEEISVEEPKEEKIFPKISSITKPKDIKVTFSGSVMFEKGSIQITKEVEKSVYLLIDLLKTRKSPFYIIFEGHTDDTDVKTNKYPSNWELSSARAAKILKMFEKNGFHRDRLIVVGHGDSMPEYKNRDESGAANSKNQKLNRRVEIKVIAFEEGAEEDLGLGIFYRDLKPDKK
jgi:chemotaxis protein MotB